VGPAGLPRIQNIKGLAGSETVENLDASLCLSQSIVSLSKPPDREMRRAASAKAAPNRKQINHTDTLHDDIADRQASRVARVFLVSHSVAATIAALAWGCAR
jgi:hypothetical protein